jgi:hypothetical protein
MLYLDSSCPNVSLGIFLKVLGFSEYFSCLKTLSSIFLEFVCTENISETKKSYALGLGRARGPDPTRSGPAWPAKAHRPEKAVAFTAGGAAALSVHATQA